MKDQTDPQLLSAYVRERSEGAFAELAERHVDLVYSAALRMIRDPHLAEDVTQGVFVALAKSAGQLTERPVLSGWLHRTTQNIAAQTIRTIERRRAREQEAVAMNQSLAAGETDVTWEQLAPQLDAVLGELAEADREALLLRYFERKSAQQMAETLGISAEAAQKRVNRAVERLRDVFAKRGVAVAAGGLAVALSANAVQAAPTGLAATVSTAGALGATTVTTAITTKIIVMTTMQKVLIAVVVATAIGTGLYEAQQASMARDQVHSLQQQLADQSRLRDTEGEKAKTMLASLTEENARLKSGQSEAELLKLRSQVGMLKQQTAAAPKNGSTAQALSDYLNDPTSRELTRVQIEEKLKTKYGPLARQLNLSPETTDKFIKSMVDSEMNKKDLLAQALHGDLDATTAIQKRDELKAELQTQLAGLLGESGYEQYDQFNRQSSAEDAVKNFNKELGDNALNDDQIRKLQGILASDPEIPVDNFDLLRSKDSLDALFQKIVDLGSNDLQQASSFLSPQQMAVAHRTQSNLFNSVRTQLTLGQQLFNDSRKK